MRWCLLLLILKLNAIWRQLRKKSNVSIAKQRTVPTSCFASIKVVRNYCLKDCEKQFMLMKNMQHKNGNPWETERKEKEREKKFFANFLLLFSIICFEEFKDGSEITCLPCFHTFDFQCIGDWLSRSDTCPVCQTKITQGIIICVVVIIYLFLTIFFHW